MSEPFIGELRLVAFNFAPKFWAECQGQTMGIAQNQALFSLFGTTYGGDGRSTFALPNLQGRVATHVGQGLVQGQSGGEVNHVLTIAELPAHSHIVNAVNATQNSTLPGSNFLANASGSVYGTAGNTTMLPAVVTNTGGSRPHENEQPYLVMNWIVALNGIFPSRN